jgi:N-acetylmuramoyl-L-alanine amidase
MRPLRVFAALCAFAFAALGLVSPAEAHGSDQEHCLALTLYWEARAEGYHGMLAVASVVLNRVRHPQFPDTVCEVVKEGGESPPCQFSWWCDGRSDVPTEARAWWRAKALARAVLNRPAYDTTAGALFFHADYVGEPWRTPRTRTVQVGAHIFYR